MKSFFHQGLVFLRAPLQSLRNVFDTNPQPSQIFLEGVYLSSRNYWNEYLKSGTGSQLKVQEKHTRTFHKYWVRSCMRSVPFGTLAGCGPLEISDGPTSVRLAKTSAYKRSIRLDIQLIRNIVTAVETIPVVQRQLTFSVNNSCYTAADKLRFAERIDKGQISEYQLTAVDSSSYLRSVLDKARSGATFQELVDVVQVTASVDAQEATSYLAMLIDSQLLVSNLEPCTTGTDPLDHVIREFDALNGIDGITQVLKEIQKMMRSAGEGVGQYEAIERQLSELAARIEVHERALVLPRELFHVDLHFAFDERKINRSLLENITDQVSDLALLAKTYRNGDLETFKMMFSKRYEEQEIPLFLALDADIGIGYGNVTDASTGGSALVDDLAGRPPKPIRSSGNTDYTESFARSKYLDYAIRKLDKIVIQEEELKRFSKYAGKLNIPHSTFVLGSLHIPPSGDEQTNFTFDLTAFSGPSGANLLSRFSGSDNEILEGVRALVREEASQDPDKIYAEVVHLPPGSVGNIIVRPALREYEIPYLGKSGLPPSQQIPIDDLQVSIRNGEIFLRSIRHNKQVIPRLSSAHNHSFNSTPLYKFLCDLQTQNIAFPNIWDWGMFASEKYLPRVVYKNIVVQKARWILSATDVGQMPGAGDDLLVWGKQIQKKCALPDRIVYKDDDNILLLDLTLPASLALLVQYLKKTDSLILEEFLSGDLENMLADIHQLPFANELVIPLARKKIVNSDMPLAPAGSGEDVQRRFLPSSEWHYFKIYCGSMSAESLLTGVIHQFIENGLAEELFEKFFFIRYKDDFSHLRIRFYNKTPVRQARLQQEFLQALQPHLDTSLIDKISIDTYNRELERYSSRSIEDVETLFHNDSLAVLRFLSLLAGTDVDKYKLLIALRSIDTFLSDFGLSLREKSRLLEHLQQGYFKEFGADPKLQKQLNEKYRAHQRDIFTHLSPECDETNGFNEVATILGQRTLDNRPAIDAIRARAPIGTGETYEDVITGCIHMFSNRIFISKQRRYELVIYHFLNKYYASAMAIAAGKQKVES